MTKSYLFWFWLPPLSYMAAIFCVSALPNPNFTGETPDYVLHTLEYFLLGLLLLRLLLAHFPRSDWHRLCCIAALLGIGFGISDEVHQYVVPGRHCSLHDVAADAFGMGLAYLAALLDYRLLKRSRFWTPRLWKYRRLRRLSYAEYRSPIS